MMADVKPVTLTDENFKAEVLDSSVPVLVDFWAPWCGPCRIIGPIVDAIATEFEGRAKVAKLNIDDFDRLATRYSVSAIPTLLIFNEGRPVDQIIGIARQDAIASKLEAVVNSASATRPVA